MADDVKLAIYRGDNSAGEMVEYSVPRTPGMVVLDAVHSVQALHEPGLAVRWNCKAGKCGSCGGEVNGKPRLMCLSGPQSSTPVFGLGTDKRTTSHPDRAFPSVFGACPERSRGRG